MVRIVHKIKRLSAASALVAPLALAVLAVFACSREKPVEQIHLPPTPVLTIRSTWAVVSSHVLRLREEPYSAARILAHLRRGTIMEVLGRTDRKESLEDQTDYWFQVSYEGLRGWVFGAYLDVFDSRVKAQAFADTLE